MRLSEAASCCLPSPPHLYKSNTEWAKLLQHLPLLCFIFNSVSSSSSQNSSCTALSFQTHFPKWISDSCDISSFCRWNVRTDYFFLISLPLSLFIFTRLLKSTCFSEKKNGDSRALLYTQSCSFWPEFWCLLGHAATAQVTLKSIPSLNTSQQISLGPHAPRRAKITHLNFLHQINNALEVKIMGQVTIFSSLPPGIFYPIIYCLYHFSLEHPCVLWRSQHVPWSRLQGIFNIIFVVGFDSWKSKIHHLKTINLPPSNLCSHNHHCYVSHFSLEHCRRCATVPIKHQASKPGGKWQGKTRAVPTSTRLCNVLPFNHTVSQRRGTAVITHHKYILWISPASCWGKMRPLLYKFSFSWRQWQLLLKQDSPCHCAAW